MRRGVACRFAGAGLAERDQIELVERIERLAFNESDAVLGVMVDRAEVIRLAPGPAFGGQRRDIAVTKQAGEAGQVVFAPIGRTGCGEPAQDAPAVPVPSRLWLGEV